MHTVSDDIHFSYSYRTGYFEIWFRSTRVDWMRYEHLSLKYGMEKGVVEKITYGVLRWYGHTERVYDEKLTKRVYK